MERRYAPYIKWFGTAFSKLHNAPHLMSIFDQILRAENWRAREQHLSAAYLVLAELHNALGVTPPVAGEITPFFNRPYLVPHSGRFVDALHAAITTPPPLPKNVGGINQFIDNTDILEDVHLCRALAGLYSDAGTPVAERNS